VSRIALLPSQFIYPLATSGDAGDLLVIQKNGELFLRAIDPTTLGYLKASGGFVDIGDNVLRGKGMSGRQGSSGGSPGNVVNFWWDSPSLQAWIDTSNIGNVLISGNGTIVSADMARGAATYARMKEGGGSVTLTNKDQYYIAASDTVSFSITCDLLLFYEIKWSHTRSQGTQNFNLFAQTGYTQGGSDTVLREFFVHNYTGIDAIVTAGGTNYPVGYSSLTLGGTAMHHEVWANQTTMNRTYWVRVKRSGTHSSAGSVEGRITQVQLRR
jgi:hypothetical protein